MLLSNHIAFKEWAAICMALDQGEQTLILRKGGIHEGTAGFRVAHSEFWLLPTGFHQAESALRPGAQGWLAQALEHRPPAGKIEIHNYAVVQDVYEVREIESLAGLAGMHVWSEAIVHQRFYYREPGLFALVVRVFRSPIVQVDETPHIAGCRSWVDLPIAIPTDNLQPVLGQHEFDQRRGEIRQLLGGCR